VGALLGVVVFLISLKEGSAAVDDYEIDAPKRFNLAVNGI
jgi:hypothetical protein